MATELIFDAIVVLGAALYADGTPSKALVRRARHGARLAIAHPNVPLIVSGGRTQRSGGPRPPWPESRVMRDIALAEGVAPHRVIEEDQATRTLENATFVRSLQRRHGWSRILVVTDGYHMPRALMVFRAAGVPCGGSAAQPFWRDEKPVASLAAILREAAAIVWYRAWLLSRVREGRNDPSDSRSN